MSIGLAASKINTVVINGATVETNNAFCATSLYVNFQQNTMQVTYTRGTVNGNGVLTPGVQSPLTINIAINLSSSPNYLPGTVVSSDGNGFILSAPQLAGAKTSYLSWWNEMEQFIVNEILAEGLTASQLYGSTQTVVTTAAIP